MSTEITERQKTILDFIQSEINTKGYPPSVREIGKATELRSTAAVLNQLRILEKKKMIRRDPSKPRAIELASRNGGKNNGEHSLPYPILQNTEITIKNITCRTEKFQNAERLRLSGTLLCRMENHTRNKLGIRHGDYILLSPESILNHGDHILYNRSGNHISFGVVEKIDEEKVVLKPTGKNGKSITVPFCNVFGKISSVIRKF